MTAPNIPARILCETCRGNGVVLVHPPTEAEARYGWCGYKPCPQCGGTGYIRLIPKRGTSA